ncbi:MAG: class II aldolase/adducin family protein [Candidatus Aminicenantales bacterium]
MKSSKRKENRDILRLFQSVGRASLRVDIQGSHSGNMAVKFTDESGRDQVVVTATGSQKGELESEQICFLSARKTDYGDTKASSETEIHARILTLRGIRASFHAHTKDLTVATLDDAKKPGRPVPFIPIDPLGYYSLGGAIPVDWMALPSGSAERAKVIYERLSQYPAMVLQAHGTFTRGRTLKEAFFLACLANNSGAIVRLSTKLRVDVESLRRKIRTAPDSCFQFPPPAYTIEDDEICEFPEEEEIQKEIVKTGARIFESRLSPFHSGSISVRSVNAMLYAPKASMPREIGGPLLRVPLPPGKLDYPELALHKKLYAESRFQTIIHCYIPEAEAQAQFVYPGENAPTDRIIPIDAEGSVLYPAIPVAPPNVDVESLIKLLHDYKVVVVRGGGIWAAGRQSLSEVLHHSSAVREICLYRIGAFEQGLDLRRMELGKAKSG